MHKYKKYKCTNTKKEMHKYKNTNAQIKTYVQMHKYKNTNAQIQKHTKTPMHK